MTNTEKCNELIQPDENGAPKKPFPQRVRPSTRFSKLTTRTNQTERQFAVQELLEKSQMPIAAIAKATGYAPSTVHELRKRPNLNSIITPKILKLAKQRLLDILELKPNPAEKVTGSGEVVPYKNYPEHGAVLAAIEKVIERSEPAVHKVESRSMAMQFISPIDLSTFRVKSGEVSEPQAISAEVAPAISAEVGNVSPCPDCPV